MDVTDRAYMNFSEFLSDRADARTIRVANLALASVALLILIGGQTNWRWPGSPPPPEPDAWAPVRGVAIWAVVLVWFAGAIGLLYRKTIAWLGSLVGSGIAAGFFVAAIIELDWLAHHPNEQLARLKDMGGRVSLNVVYFSIGAFLSIPAFISTLLFVGLLFNRKELIAPREEVADR